MARIFESFGGLLADSIARAEPEHYRIFAITPGVCYDAERIGPQYCLTAARGYLEADSRRIGEVAQFLITTESSQAGSDIERLRYFFVSFLGSKNAGFIQILLEYRKRFLLIFFQFHISGPLHHRGFA